MPPFNDAPTQAKDILDHVLVPENEKDPRDTFRSEIAMHLKEGIYPHPQTQNVYEALQAIENGDISAKSKICLEKNIIPVIRASHQRYTELMETASEVATGDMPPGLEVSEKMKIEEGDSVARFAVAKNSIKELEAKVRTLASTLGITLQEADRSV